MNEVNVCSWNVCADFFGKGTHHEWSARAPKVKSYLANGNFDVICLQELSPDQALEIYTYINDSNDNKYNMITLSQTPSEVPTGAIVVNEEVGEWVGKFVGTALISILVKGEITKSGRFWLNSEPHELPTNTDRTITDKGFGNMNTYRAVLYCSVKIPGKSGPDRELYVFNSHYPISGGNNCRYMCADVERYMINQVINDDPHVSDFVSCGDRNLIPNPPGCRDIDEKAVLAKLTDGYNTQQNATFFLGNRNNTWIGFTYDSSYEEVTLLGQLRKSVVYKLAIL